MIGSAGSKGSHWESSLFPFEIMQPQAYYDMTFSNLTLALFDSMGW
jgi:hypothetical protein